MADETSTPADLTSSLLALLPLFNRLFGIKAETWEELVAAVLPARINTVQRLAVLYEREMIACRDGKAYYAACVMGAAMIEAFLLLLCMLNPDTVQNTRRYKDRAGKKSQNFEFIISCFGMDDFIEISAELNWIPSTLISEEWKQSLPAEFLEVVLERHPNMSKASRESHAKSLTINPAYSLMSILNMMRNRMHAGKWVKQNNVLQNEEAFSGWAQVALVAAAHIRDCLLLHHQQSMIELIKLRLMERAKIN